MGILLNKGKNYIINGAMDFWQRGTSFVSVANGSYTADRFQYGKNATTVHNIARDTDVPTFAQAGFTFPYSMSINLSTAQASIAAGDYCLFEQKIEGQIFAPLAGEPITLSFWVKASLVGQYSVSFRNSNGTRSLARSFTINSANTWEKKTISITHDTAGTWNYDSSHGISITFVLASGSNYIAPSQNTWFSGNYIAASGQINGVQSGATNFKITGVQLEEGVSASNFERAGGNTANEFQLCQRYYEKTYELSTIPGTATNTGAIFVRNNQSTANTFGIYSKWQAPKRVSPNVAIYSAGGVLGQYTSDATGYLSSGLTQTTNSFAFGANNGGQSVVAGMVSMHVVADAEL